MARSATARVLAIDPDEREQQEIRRLLEASGTGVPRRPPFEVHGVPTLAEGLTLLQGESFDAVIVSLPASGRDALECVSEVRERYGWTPVVLVLDRDDEKIALEAASRGAQDCIVRNELVGNLLARSLQYAIERQQLQAQLERRSVMDELTGLYNRRGFFAVGEQEWKRARRKGDGFLLVYADLDGLKTINDRHGHEEGDGLIKAAAGLLATVFRDTDILARLGGDEFAVIAHQTGTGGAEVIRERITRELESTNRGGSLHHPLAMSVGIVPFDPGALPTASLDELLSRADALMYQEKQRRRSEGPGRIAPPGA